MLGWQKYFPILKQDCHTPLLQAAKGKFRQAEKTVAAGTFAVLKCLLTPGRWPLPVISLPSSLPLF